jgi:hypothetical protein
MSRSSELRGLSLDSGSARRSLSGENQQRSGRLGSAIAAGAVSGRVGVIVYAILRMSPSFLLTYSLQPALGSNDLRQV